MADPRHTVDERIEQLLRAYRRKTGIHAAVAVWGLEKLDKTRRALLEIATDAGCPPRLKLTALAALGVASPELMSTDDFPPDDPDLEVLS